MALPRNIRFLFEHWEYDDNNEKRFGSWSQSYSGERYWSLDPRPEEIHTVDVVQGLVNAARYRGQTKFFYPVLTHAVLVSRAAEQIALEQGIGPAEAKEIGFEGLHHDDSEAYLGDVARPLKRTSAMRKFCKIEALWDKAIHERYGINSTYDSHAIVKEADTRIVLDEIYAVMRDPDMWRRSGRYLELEPLYIEVPNWSQEEAIYQYYKREKELRTV